MNRCLLFVGQCVIDHRFEVDSVPVASGKSTARDSSTQLGGLAANAARAAARLRGKRGPEIVLASAVGEDPAGRWMLAALDREAIHAAHVQQVPGARTSISAILVGRGGERQVINDRGTALLHASPPSLDLLEDCAAVLADPRWPVAAVPILRAARARGIPSVLDAEAAPALDLRALVPLADWVVFSSAGLDAWWRRDAMAAPMPQGARSQSLQGLIEALASVAIEAPTAELVVTLGERGALWRRPSGEVEHVPAFAVDVVDTNGAGDAMHGALVLALAEGFDARSAMRFAIAAGALACTRRDGFADRAQVNDLLAGAAGCGPGPSTTKAG